MKSNIYGVDINAASVEIARLALWLHTARGDKPLSSLEGTIKEGNSLINSDFYKGQIDLDFYSDDERERVNVFDWDEAFPEVFERGGFDAVVGNPPYVKLQNFRKVHADMAKFLKDGREGVDEISGYASAKTGNFDLYLPFIEKGLTLLNENGRLGYIAPSVWVMNKYGAGLRQLISRGKQLHRWLDFKSHQIFDEATVYTSLQFYSKSENKNVEIAYAPDGSVPEEPWADPTCQLSYKRLNFDDRWLLVTGPERSLIDKLTRSCRRLDSKSVTTNIFVGLQTSADEIYHLKRIGTNRYLHTPKGKNAPPPYEVIIEEELMKPLVSGVDAKRYEVPDGDTCILFPYQNVGDRASLIPINTMKSSYPNAWKYLTNFEAQLKRREAGLDEDGDFNFNEFGRPEKAPFNDEEWYRYGRHQALGNQEKKKLIVAQTVPSMRVCADFEANLYLNNVRVNGILTAGDDLSFLLGVLNSKTVDWVFKRIAKPKDGGWFEANKQFIAPLPIPKVTPDEFEEVSKRATELHDAHTALRNISKHLAKRTSEMPSKVRPLTFLFPDIVIAKHRIDTAPATLEAKEKRDWAKKKHAQELNNRYEEINKRLDGSVRLRATLDKGELTFLIDEAPIIDKVFVSEDEAPLILAQWKTVASTFNSTGKEPGKKLCSLLRKLVVTTNEAQINQIIKLQEQLGELEISIDVQEREMNQLTYELYDLTPEEISMVERG